ncbi:MAG: hypothetical protein MUC34_13650, partial [Anaerolineae bacterium]|nr:hypothetical protein [Anaerolineae bacterium]
VSTRVQQTRQQGNGIAAGGRHGLPRNAQQRQRVWFINVGERSRFVLYFTLRRPRKESTAAPVDCPP